MRELLKPLGLAALVALSGPAFAQDTATPAAPQTDSATPPVADTAQIDGLPMGESEAETAAPAQPQAYVKDTFNDWRVVCVKGPEDRESCNMQQLLRDDNDNPVSQVSIAPLPPAAAPRAAAVEIATPLETLLSEDLRLAVDSSAAKRYRFSFCTPQACYARFALSAEDVAAFKAGKAATVTIVPLMAPDQTAKITMSLSGFTAAYDSVLALFSE
ncbi:invasion associated locus B family protein [Rhodovulum marinum]|uniref:Invasion protein IalB n=1 Tax=Rhodovulum marinum TaxID=320662 RepID=A0A4R2Q119_9RHOB|nr:invasion associated locus B family protein [Rhodovulum marinum]TCP42177.1 invasion protein IalB [Rhodovulum marinum]